MACSNNFFALRGAAAMMKLLTLFAAYMLQVAGVVIAVDIPVFRFSAMVAFAHDYILVRLVDRNGNALIKYITFSVE
ncbi:Uncharacterised protein [Actinobacillus pleuropneumoniae]|nr:Uncharacterised protein [Actinobacillus pleuropneumoniae]